MSEEEEINDDEPASRLLLPQISRRNIRSQKLSGVLQILKSKRRQFQRARQQNQPSNQFNFKYLSRRYDDQRYLSKEAKEAFQEEMLGRGNASSIIQDKKGNQNVLPKTPLITIAEYPYGHQKSRAQSVVNSRIDRQTISGNSRIHDDTRSVLLRQSQISKQPNHKIKQRVNTQPHLDEVDQNEQQTSRQTNKAVIKFKEIIMALPKSKAKKTQTVIEPILQILEQFNPFFRKIERVVGYCLFRINQVLFKSEGQLIYKRGDELDYFYIILLGQIKLQSRLGMCKVCVTGQTVFQQILYKNDNSELFDSAKTTRDCYLLEVKCRRMGRMEEQLVRSGFKLELQQFQTMIKRNFIVKGWVKSKFRLLVNK